MGVVPQLKDVQFAYSVLSDPDRRRAYDTLGESAVMEDEGSGCILGLIKQQLLICSLEYHHGPHSIFSQFFGGGESMFGELFPICVLLTVLI